MNDNQSCLPQEFCQRLQHIVSVRKYPVVINSLQDKPRVSFRINTLKAATEKVKKSLINDGFKLSPVAWYQDALTIPREQLEDLTNNELYQHGMIYIQSHSSMVPALILNPQPGETVADIAAAPGSKTTQMAALMNNTGEILANDRSRERMFKLKTNLERLDITNTKFVNKPAEMLWKLFPEKFDKTLADVPCSLEGEFNSNNPKTYEGWSVKKVKKLAKIQQWILRSALSMTKPGGTIVYSTCTLSPEENEGVIDWVLAKEDGAVEVEPVSLAVPNQTQGLLSWEGKEYYPAMLRCIRILPSEEMEGFFIAKLRKLRSTVNALSYIGKRWH